MIRLARRAIALKNTSLKPVFINAMGSKNLGYALGNFAEGDTGKAAH